MRGGGEGEGGTEGPHVSVGAGRRRQVGIRTTALLHLVEFVFLEAARDRVPTVCAAIKHCCDAGMCAVTYGAPSAGLTVLAQYADTLPGGLQQLYDLNIGTKSYEICKSTEWIQVEAAYRTRVRARRAVTSLCTR